MIMVFGLVSQRGAKRFVVEIAKIGVGGGPHPGSGRRLPLMVHPRSLMCWRRSEGDLGRLHPGNMAPVQRSTRSRSGGSRCIKPQTNLGLVSLT